MSSSDLGSAEANRRFYETHAERYDSTEFCVFDEAPQRRLRLLLEHALAIANPDPSVLDAGGGTGNASLILHELGVEPTLVDASPEMVARWETKAEARGYRPRSELADLESFFNDDSRTWDLIVFSSVLHHLNDPTATLVSAGRRLKPGGLIVTVFDPLEVSGTGALLRWLDYGCWLAFHSPRALLRAIPRRFKRTVLRRARLGRRSDRAEPNLGALAERHAMSGIDDEELTRMTEESGLVTVEHARFFDARYRWIVALARRVATPSHFSLTVRRPGSVESIASTPG